MKTLCAEFAYLAACVGRARGLIPRQEIITAASLPINERAFLKLAEQHKCLELVLDGGISLDQRLAPETLAKLRMAVRQRRLARELILREWNRIGADLNAAGFSFLTMKGPALAFQLYGDAAAREYRDLDLLFDMDSKDLTAIMPILAGAGYDFKNNPVLATTRHLSAQHRDLPVFIEIHGRIGLRMQGFFRIPASVLFGRAATVQWQGKSALCPAFEDHGLLHLAHGSHHFWAVLAWIADAAVFFQRIDDRQRLWASIRQWDMEAVAVNSLYMAQRFYRLPGYSPYPPKKFIAVRQASIRAYNLLIDKSAKTTESGRNNPTPSKLAAIQMTFNRVAYMSRFQNPDWNILMELLPYLRPNQRDWAMFRLPKSLGFLYWFLRPILMTVRIARELFRIKGSR